MTNHNNEQSVNANSRLSLKEIADQYELKLSAVRAAFKNADPTLLQGGAVEEGKGRRPSTYSLDFVRAVMKGDPPASGLSNLNEVERKLFGKNANGYPIKVSAGVIGSPDVIGNPVIGVLASRLRAHAEYIDLVTKMTIEGPELRIRCITGTDFFNSQSYLYWLASLKQRVEQAKLSKPKVLLVYPRGRAAKLRSLAEGEKLADSQFDRDADSSHKFIKNKLHLMEVRWADEIPPSMLIWTQDVALLEPYDYGGRGSDAPGCIGRRAPILVLRGGSEFHKALQEGFDCVYDGGKVPIDRYHLGSKGQFEKMSAKPQRKTSHNPYKHAKSGQR